MRIWRAAALCWSQKFQSCFLDILKWFSWPLIYPRYQKQWSSNICLTFEGCHKQQYVHWTYLLIWAASWKKGGKHIFSFGISDIVVEEKLRIIPAKAEWKNLENWPNCSYFKSRDQPKIGSNENEFINFKWLYLRNWSSHFVEIQTGIQPLNPAFQQCTGCLDACFILWSEHDAMQFAHRRSTRTCNKTLMRVFSKSNGLAIAAFSHDVAHKRIINLCTKWMLDSNHFMLAIHFWVLLNFNIVSSVVYPGQHCNFTMTLPLNICYRSIPHMTPTVLVNILVKWLEIFQCWWSTSLV